MTIAIPKGGVGKTTTAVNLAASFAVYEKRTLLIDADPFGACSMSLGFTPEKTHGGLFEVFNFIHSMSQVIHRTELAFLDFIPCNVHTTVTEERLMRIAENRTMLRNVLRSTVPHYDYIVIDTPPFLRGLTTNALACTDSVLVPMKSGHFSLEGIDKLFKYIDWIREAANKNLVVEGILQTMYEPHLKVTEITDRELQLRFKRHMLTAVIPKNTHLTEASFYGRPAVLFNATSRGTLAYMELARELIERSRSSAASEQTPIQQEQSA
ncbi:MAG TPA: ParA family protein [Bacteroidota bacterium]|nr:ParA family protein [Bacteroidota bacterium]